MKKAFLTLSLVALLSSCSSFADLLGDEASFTDEQKTSFVNFFLNPIKVESDIHFSYYSDEVTFHSVDQIAPTRRHLYMTAEYQGTSTFIGETSVYGKDDAAYSETLSLQNEVVSEAILDSDENPVSYSQYYSSWFKLPSSYSLSSFSKYFSVASSGSGYSVTLTPIGAGILLPRLADYLPSVDSSTYDSASYKETFEDFVIGCDENGVPTSMSFRLIYSDRYGGTYQEYSSALSSIEEAVGILPYEPTSSASDREELDALLSELGAKLEVGNFTTHTQYYLEDASGGRERTELSYNCYYELDSTPSDGGHYPLMLSDYELEASEYGLTLTGLYYWADDGLYCPTGVSPNSSFIEPLNSTTYEDVASCVPGIHEISSSFYEKNSDGSFSFDLASVDFDTYYFSYSLVEEVLGVGDYVGTYLGVLKASSSSFNLQELTFYKDGENYVAELRAVSQVSSSYYLTAQVTFSSFGTTSLEEVDNATIASCLELVKEYERTL